MARRNHKKIIPIFTHLFFLRSVFFYIIHHAWYFVKWFFTNKGKQDKTMGSRGSSSGISNAEQYQKTIRAMSALKQDIKKWDSIVNGKAYYSESVKERARINLERDQTAYNVLSAKADLLEAKQRNQDRQQEIRQNRKNKKKRESKIVDFSAYRKSRS